MSNTANFTSEKLDTQFKVKDYSSKMSKKNKK